MGHDLYPTRAFAFLSSVMIVLTACSPEQTPAVPRKTLFPVKTPELRALLAGHYLRDCNGPADSGPLIFRDDGTFEKVTGFANYRGTFKVTDGEVFFRGVQDEQPVEFTTRFFNDEEGVLFFGDNDNAPRPADLRKIDEHARSLNCTSG